MLFAKILLAIGSFLGMLSFPAYLLFSRLWPKNVFLAIIIGIILFFVAFGGVKWLAATAGLEKLYKDLEIYL